MNLNEIAIFIKVVELGSFIAATNSLDMPKYTVSAKVSSLEKRLGVTLIRRTTIKLHITDIGKKYPQVVLELILTDRPIDLIAEGVDIGIRTGALKDFAPSLSPL